MSASDVLGPRPARYLRATVVVLLVAALGLFHGIPLAWQPRPPKPAPGPLSVRTRTNKLRNTWTGLPRPAPKEADVALDYFQRTFPAVTTEEHQLILRWEDLAAVFGGAEAANELVLQDPSVLRASHPAPRRAFQFLSRYLGPEVARYVAFQQPFILTKRAGTMRKTLPALLNIFGTRKRLAEIALKYPSLMHVPTGDFYKGMPNMISVCGNPERALEVSKSAMDMIRKRPRRSIVPECYPTLVALLGGMEEANAAIDREPLLLKWLGEQFLGKLERLRSFIGKDNPQVVFRKAPYLLLQEGQRKSYKFTRAFVSMEKIFGKEEATRRVLERPEILSLGVCLQRALGFAERKLGSIEAVRDNFDDVLRRTGLEDHLVWETKPRPRSPNGIWTPMKPKTRPNASSWSPHRNPTGRAGPARGRWDERSQLESEDAFIEAELVGKW